MSAAPPGAREEWARTACVVFAQLRAIRVLLQLRQRGETQATAGGSRAGLWLAWSLAAATASFVSPSAEALVATALATVRSSADVHPSCLSFRFAVSPFADDSDAPPAPLPAHLQLLQRA